MKILSIVLIPVFIVLSCQNTQNKKNTNTQKADEANTVHVPEFNADSAYY